MDRFLVQVSKDAGFANIMGHRRYENDRWKQKPRDSAHGEVKPGDELLVYCTSNVPQHRKLLAFCVRVKEVSSDNVTFHVGEPQYFKARLKRAEIHELVDLKKLPDVFYKCGQQGFNITRIDPDSASLLLSRLNGEPIAHYEPATYEEDQQSYTIVDILEDGCFLGESKLKAMVNRLKCKKNLILQGPPGTGKTWLAKRLAYALVGKRSNQFVRPFQFHPNVSYEDFVRGWRPNLDGRLDLVDGPFLTAIKDSIEDSSNDYVVVIEEINRGNPAQIFGEMLTLLEADKRNVYEALKLSYSRDDMERVYIPPNFHVIGTMNLADRSIALVDFALRRRFAYITLEPTFGKRWREWVEGRSHIDSSFLTKIEERLNQLNQTIAEDSALGLQFRVGHSVVTPPGDFPIADPLEWFRTIVETEIGPLLEEYWFDDIAKARAESEKLTHGLTY